MSLLLESLESLFLPVLDEFSEPQFLSDPRGDDFRVTSESYPDSSAIFCPLFALATGKSATESDLFLLSAIFLARKLV